MAKEVNRGNYRSVKQASSQIIDDVRKVVRDWSKDLVDGFEEYSKEEFEVNNVEVQNETRTDSGKKYIVRLDVESDQNAYNSLAKNIGGIIKKDISNFINKKTKRY